LLLLLLPLPSLLLPRLVPVLLQLLVYLLLLLLPSLPAASNPLEPYGRKFHQPS
jgi:hypothetical protein